MAKLATQARLEAINDPSAAAADLWRAADQCDHVLQQYARAVSLYDELLSRFPNARLSRPAQIRRDYVARGIAGGEEPFRRFETVRARFSIMGLDAARAEVVAIRHDFPSFPLGDELVLWLADRAAEQGDLKQARARYEEMLSGWPDSPQKGYALAGLARTAFAMGDYATAEKAYAAIADTTSVAAQYVSATEVARIRHHVARMHRERVVVVALLALLLLAAATLQPSRLPGAARSLAGKETLYALPLLGAIVLLSPEENRGVVAGVMLIAAVYLLLALLWAEAARPAVIARRGGRIAALFLGVAGAAGTLYTALYLFDALIAIERLAGVDG